jgi:hypothetical protein
MEIACPKCGRSLGKVESIARLILTVHCPYEGHDFGLAVDPSAAVTDAAAADAANQTPKA